MKIIHKKTSELIPYARNNKTHNKDQIKKIASSIQEFGFKNPVLIDKNNSIIAGHGRTLGAELLGMETIPCIIASDLTKAQIKAYRIADNKLAELSEWDNEMLGLELKELSGMDFDLNFTGFGVDELEGFKLDNVIEGDMEGKEDETLEVQEIAYSKMGDLWILGKHRLLCGDSTKEEDVKKLMDGEKADMVFTDPPYGINYSNNMNDKFDTIKNDDVFLEGWIPLVQKYSNGFIFMWTSYQVIKKWIDITKQFGKITNMVIWSKGGGGLGDLKGAFATDFEIALVWNRGAKLTGKRIGSVWSYNKDAGATYLHPTQKPVILSYSAIDKTTNIGDIVLDLFGGSGSTLIGAEQSNRKARIIELDEKYIDVIVKRYHNLEEKEDIKLIRDGIEYKWEDVKGKLGY